MLLPGAGECFHVVRFQRDVFGLSSRSPQPFFSCEGGVPGQPSVREQVVLEKVCFDSGDGEADGLDGRVGQSVGLGELNVPHRAHILRKESQALQQTNRIGSDAEIFAVEG